VKALSHLTATLRGSGRRALVPFFTAGYPDERTFVEVVRAAVDAGADAIEIGVPFSDPIADGPVIQAASAAALEGGMTLARAMELSGRLASHSSPPLVMMSYVNPILSYGLERFAADARAAGIGGLIAPDVSFEESADLRSCAREGGLDYVDLIAPTSSDERIARIAGGAAGFLYLVSVTGVTGTREAPPESLPTFVSRVRAHSDTPLYVGFGVATPEHAAAVAVVADGVIIGSRLIRLLGDGDAGSAPSRVAAFLGDVRCAIDNS
jgi:tryptophan synthase alpha chain